MSLCTVCVCVGRDVHTYNRLRLYGGECYLIKGNGWFRAEFEDGNVIIIITDQ